MKYYKNAELAKLYNVSEKSVRNWIDTAQQGKLTLDLCVVNDRVFIADSLHNSVLLAKLVERGRKYRNQRSHRKLRPKQGFYSIYTHEQVLDICHDLEIHRELAVKYRYFGEGGQYWDRYLEKLFKAGAGNLLTNTVEALEFSYDYLDALTQNYSSVNIVNLCVGNTMAAKNLIEHFKSEGRLRRIIAIDISQTMLNISEKRIAEWFGDELRLEKYIRDLGYERFQDVLGKTSFNEESSKTINLVLLLAGPLVNFREPKDALRVIHQSMGKQDILVLSLKRDTPEARRFFDFNINAEEGLLNLHDRLLLELLNIDDSCFDVEQFFDEEKHVRVQQIRLKLDITLSFESGEFLKEIHLLKGEAIKIWRSWHHSENAIINRLKEAKFTTEGLIKSKDNQLMLLIAKIAPDPPSL